MNIRGILPLLTIIIVNVCGSKEECGQIGSESNSSYPWNVGIYLQNQNQLELICFGSVIQSNAVLTAAHCFCDNLAGKLRDGSFYMATDNLSKTINLKTSASSLHKINKNSIHIHKHYKGITQVFAFDLAIIKNKFNFNNSITPVCVDWSGDIKDNNSQGKQSIWNKNKVTNIDQTFLTSDDCYGAPKSFASFLIQDKICTKVETPGIHLSHESEGSGLVFSHDGKWYIKGVTSMNEVGQGELSTYTTIKQYLNWISNICATE